MDKSVRVAVVGATGLVGRELLAGLADSGHPEEHVTALATERSAGKEADFGAGSLEVEATTPESFRGMNLVVLATPSEASKVLAPQAQAAGAWVVDLSQAFLADPAVPVLFSGLNAQAAVKAAKAHLLRLPSASTWALATLLTPLKARFGLKEVSVTALLGASSAGHRGVSELEQQTANLLSGRELDPGHFPHRLAFNVIPQVGPFAAGGGTGEELAWRADLMRLWAGESQALVDGTALQVPTFFGHALSVTVKLGQSTEALEVRNALSSVGPSLKVLDQPTEKVYPMPMLVMGDLALQVGRVRPFAGLKDAYSLFAALDNVGRGAAQNALEAARAVLAS
jgi:aspartate-semialdehyde dehydrogenase